MTGPSTPPGAQSHRISVVRTGQSEVLRETRKAIFLDRDGTIIKDVGYIKNPDDVSLMPGAAMALRVAHNVQRPVFVVTNQSGIARGLVTQEEYVAVRRRTGELLAEFGAFVDAEYVCPHHPDFTGPCECRKPGVLLYEQAMREHGIDGASSAFIGDRWRDVAPALHYGGTGILVPTATTPPDEIARAQVEAHVAPTLLAAIEAAVIHVPPNLQ
ncbi:MAG: HAD family hydrolase [Gemmatimonadetes bacterium]|nr:HAD family hydrolase [Gemmatimonadota bacterium]